MSGGRGSGAGRAEGCPVVDAAEDDADSDGPAADPEAPVGPVESAMMPLDLERMTRQVEIWHGWIVL